MKSGMRLYLKSYVSITSEVTFHSIVFRRLDSICPVITLHQNMKTNSHIRFSCFETSKTWTLGKKHNFSFNH